VTALAPASTHAAFNLLRETVIAELRTTARLYQHKQTGAQVLSMENDDENKVFGISFYTPATDSTGLPHIMEHSVLCGSRRYPVKEPFIELVKGSLATFINAMTFADKTVYPVASQNVQDFYNLIDVYLDSVFYPRISEDTLRQEGWHYEAVSKEEPLVYKGVVFNEMKGAYSSPEGLLGRLLERSLFPDTPYQYDMGGDPRAIPSLTYDQFKAFHDTYYHPSNALIYFYGDDDPAKRFEIIDAYLKDFTALPATATTPLQAPFAAPRTITQAYDASEGQEDSFVALAWVLGETSHPESMALRILNEILIGSPAAPLYKALIDSGLGEGISLSGIDDQLRQMYFYLALSGVADENVPQVEALVLSTLQTLAEQGIDAQQIESVLNTSEFELREMNTGAYPRGLFMMMNALSTWVYGGDPLAPLAFEAPLAKMKADLAANPRYFEGLIRRYLLENPHRSIIQLKPDSQLAEQREAEERQKLAAVRSSLSPQAFDDLLAETHRLRSQQETPDSLDDLAKLPTLSISDLSPTVRKIPTAEASLHGATILSHDLFTNGILYLDIGFNLHALPSEYLPLVELFGTALLEMGTNSQDFVKLAQRVGSKTGGIDASRFSSMRRDGQSSSAYLFLRGKCTPAQSDDLLAIIRDLLLAVNFDNKARFAQIVGEEKSDLEAAVVPSGHTFVDTRLRANFNEIDWAEEQMSGIAYLNYVRALAKQVEDDWAGVLAKLEAMRKLLINQAGLIINLTADAPTLTMAHHKLDTLLQALPNTPFTAQKWGGPALPNHEGLTIPAQVNYVGLGGDLFAAGYTLHGSYMAITRVLSTGYLWDKIRMQGGAYGAFAQLDPYAGLFTFGSYRDPNLLGTLDNYAGAAAYLRELSLNQAEVTRAIVGAIGSLDRYQLPDAKGYTALIRHLVGETDATRQKTRDQVLNTTLADFHRFGDALAALVQNASIKVIGSVAALERANTERDNFLAISKVL
jgi:presequence protease